MTGRILVVLWLLFSWHAAAQPNPPLCSNLGDEAARALAAGNPQQAEKAARQAIEAAEKKQGDGSAALCADAIAASYRDAGDLNRSEKMYSRSLKIRQRAFGENHAETAEAYARLGRVSADLRKWREAANLYHRALAIREKIDPPDSQKLADALVSLGAVYFTEARYMARVLGEGQVQLTRALAGAGTGADVGYESRSAALNAMEDPYPEHKAKDLFQRSEPLYRRALAIREKHYGPSHVETAVVAEDLGVVCAEIGRLEESEALLKRALAVWESVGGPNHPRVGETLGKYALMLRKAKRDPEALQVEARRNAILGKN